MKSHFRSRTYVPQLTLGQYQEQRNIREKADKVSFDLLKIT